MSLKILHVINGLGRGGAEEMLHKLIRYNENNKKVQHFILSLSKNDPTLENRFKEYNIEVLNFNFFNFIKILFHLKKKKINIIQGWMYHGNSFAFFLKFFFSKSKLFFNIRHSLPNYKFENIKNLISIYISKIFSKYTSYCIYNSLTSKQTHEKIGFGGKSEIVRNGFYFDKRNKNKKPFFIEDENLIIGIVSRFHKIKGHEVFLKALQKLKQKKITVIFIGNATGSREFKEFVKSYKINNRFIYIDEVFYPKDYTVSMDLIINSSYSESMPNIIGEAFSQEIFAIASDTGDTRLYFSDKRFLFKPGNSNDLAKKIELFVNLSENEKKLIIRNNKKLIAKNFNMKKCSQEYYRLYYNG